MAAQVEAIAGDIAAFGPSFDALGATASALQVSASAASDRVGLDLWLVRLLILALGAVIIAIGVVAQRFSHAWLIAGVDPLPGCAPRTDLEG